MDKRVQKGKQKNTTYLIKWRGLPYEECTWEDESSLTSKEDKEKVNQYNGMYYILYSHYFFIVMILTSFTELEAAALKRSNKPRKIVKFSKSMDPPQFEGGRELKDFQKVCP